MDIKQFICTILILILFLSLYHAYNTYNSYTSNHTMNYMYSPPAKIIKVQDYKLAVVTRKPSLGECLVAPIDFVVCICKGVVGGVSATTSYISDTIVPQRLTYNNSITIYQQNEQN